MSIVVNVVTMKTDEPFQNSFFPTQLFFLPPFGHDRLACFAVEGKKIGFDET